MPQCCPLGSWQLRFMAPSALKCTGRSMFCMQFCPIQKERLGRFWPDPVRTTGMRPCVAMFGTNRICGLPERPAVLLVSGKLRSRRVRVRRSLGPAAPQFARATQGGGGQNCVPIGERMSSYRPRPKIFNHTFVDYHRDICPQWQHRELRTILSPM